MTGNSLLLIAFAYLLGSIPFGLILAKHMKRIDLRRYGSSNIGATNAFRVAGKAIGAGTLFCDIAKGAIPVAMAVHAFPEPVVALTAAAAFLGHIFPIYLAFHGGKGVATMFGVLIPWQPWTALGASITWLVTAWVSRYVAIASTAAALSAPLLAWITGASHAAITVCVLFSFIVSLRHVSNFKRLLAGNEPRIGQT